MARASARHSGSVRVLSLSTRFPTMVVGESFSPGERSSLSSGRVVAHRNMRCAISSTRLAPAGVPASCLDHVEDVLVGDLRDRQLAPDRHHMLVAGLPNLTAPARAG